MGDTVLMDVRDRVAYVTLNRPEKLNAINNAMLADLFATFQEVKDNPDIWLVVLTGAGRAFSTGHDLVMGREDVGGRRTPGAAGSTDDFYTFFSRIWKPIIAAINGYCLAQGGGLALLSDIRIASERAQFGWPQVKRGIASISGPTILAHHVPLGAAFKFLFTGEFCDAQEAYRLGLVQEVVPHGQLLDRYEVLARMIVENSAPLAVRLSGHLQITGDPDREPVKIGGPFAQYTGGQVACAATLLALFSAMTTGQGQQVDCAIVEANVDLLDSWGVNAVLGVQQPRSGMRHHNIYPAQIYPCRDGYVVLGTEPAGWQAFVELVGDDALRHPEYAGPERQRYREEIDAILCAWLRDRRKLEVYEAAQARRLASGYLMTPEDMLASPQLQAPGYFQEGEHPNTGAVHYPGAPFRLSRTAWRQTRAPLLGEHNQEVYGQRLGLSTAELVRLRQQGVI